MKTEFELLRDAYFLIASASIAFADGTKPSKEWRDASARWRNEFGAYLANSKPDWEQNENNENNNG